MSLDRSPVLTVIAGTPFVAACAPGSLATLTRTALAGSDATGPSGPAPAPRGTDLPTEAAAAAQTEPAQVVSQAYERRNP
ncbi:MAG: hypothetical protein Q4G45_07260 [Actinomycetia bacterium]|nr:hypothetical protein [Actinomycetes bacterium]